MQNAALGKATDKQGFLKDLTHCRVPAHTGIKLCIVLTLLLFWPCHTKAQTCGLAPACYVQYKVTGANLHKCVFEEYTNATLPRIHYYHNQTTHVTSSYSYSWSGNNGCSEFVDDPSGSSYNHTVSPGPFSGNEAYNFDVTEYERAPGMYCDYTNTFAGGWSKTGNNNDTRGNEQDWLTGTAYYEVWVSNYCASYNDSMSVAYLTTPTVSNNGWYFIVKQNITGSEVTACSPAYTVTTVSLDSSSTNISPASLEFVDATPIIASPVHKYADLIVTNGINIDCLTNPTSFVQTSHGTMDLDTEYSDAELWTNIMSLMPDYPSDWYVPGSIDESSVAYSAIDAAHYAGDPWTGSHNAELQKMKYQFCVPGSEWGVEYKITWDLVTCDVSMLSWSRSSQTTTVQGTGDPSNPALSDVFEVLPPDWDQSDIGGYVFIWVDNIQVSVVPKSTATPPGSGPNWLGSVTGGGCSTCGGGRTSAANSPGMGGFSAMFSMGRATVDESAGELRIESSLPSLLLATPANLAYGTNHTGTAVVWASNQLRQVNAPQALADIVVLNAFSYEIRFYLPSQVVGQADGVYQVSGDSFVTWRIENPDASTNTYNRLRLTEIRGSTVKVYDSVYNTNTCAWTFDYPGGLREDEVSFIATTNTSSLVLIVTNTTRIPGGADLLKVRRVYQAALPSDWHLPPAGLALVEETLDPDNNPQTTTYTYAQNGWYGSAKPVSLVVHPDGSWERFYYDDFGRKNLLLCKYCAVAAR